MSFSHISQSGQNLRSAFHQPFFKSDVPQSRVPVSASLRNSMLFPLRLFTASSSPFTVAKITSRSFHPAIIVSASHLFYTDTATFAVYLTFPWKSSPHHKAPFRASLLRPDNQAVYQSLLSQSRTTQKSSSPIFRFIFHGLSISSNVIALRSNIAVKYQVQLPLQMHAVAHLHYHVVSVWQRQRTANARV